MTEWSQVDSPQKPGSFLDALSEQERQYLHDRGRMEHFSPGDMLLEYRGRSNRVLILMEGSAKVIVPGEDGRESLVALRGPSEILGELAAIDDEPHMGNVVAIDSILALVVSKADFRQLLENSPAASIWILTRTVKRLRESDRARAEFGLSDTAGRVAARLVELAERYGQSSSAGVVIDLPLTQDELAAWVGATREAVARTMKLFRKLEWVTTERRLITVKDLDALRRRAS